MQVSSQQFLHSIADRRKQLSKQICLMHAMLIFAVVHSYLYALQGPFPNARQPSFTATERAM